MPETLKSKQMQKTIKNLLSTYGIYLVFIILVIWLSTATSGFLTFKNISNVVRQVSINGIMAIGMTFIIITSGIDLSAGSIVALSGVVAASVAHPGQFPLIVPILVGLLVGGLCGFANGSLIAFTRIPPFIVTLGMTQIASGVALLYSKGRPIINISPEFANIGQGMLFKIPLPIYIFVLIIIIGFIVLHRTRFGRYVYSVGGNETAALVSGIKVRTIKLSVYTIAGVLYGLASVILVARTNSGTPNAGVGYELNAIAAAVIGGTSTTGGRGSIIGTVIGALIMGVLSNGLDVMNIQSYYQLIIKGLIIIGAVWLDTTATKNK